MDMLRQCSSDFLARILNNSEILLQVFDDFFIKEDFIKIPGDEEIVNKRMNIKRLVRKKVSGKAGEQAGPRGYKKKWPGLQVTNLDIEENKEPAFSKELESYKLDRHKATISYRSNAFDAFMKMF